MSIKQFLKPDWRKIIVLIILLSLTLFYSRKELITTSFEAPGFAYYLGFPLYYLKIQTGFEVQPFLVSFKQLLNFIIDLIFWYLLSCLIIWIYDKFKKKPQLNRF